jgi:transmembrane 9 superfamily protein 2/4
MHNPAAGLLSLCSLLSVAYAFYLPGVAPTTYARGDRVPLHVNRLSPAQSQTDGQVHAIYDYDYYSTPFHFCQPPDGPEYLSESLGSILFGDRIQTSPFELHMAHDEPCKTIPSCGTQEYAAVDAKFVNKRIEQNYDINWLVDGLPAGQLLMDPSTETEFYSPGFDLGHMSGDKPVFHNHYDIYVDYHEAASNQFRVVGIIVEPSSNKNAEDFGKGAASGGSCSNAEDLILDEKGGTKVVFTYSVYWRPSETPFATRWDKYLHVYDPKIHWFSLINSAIIVVALVGMVVIILVRTLRKDITRYNKLDQFSLNDMNGDSANSAALPDDDVQEDSGWKLIHGDVFRPPQNTLALSVLVGNGAQLFLMAGFTIAFAGLGFLSPSNRGALGSVMILLYCLFGLVSGFISTYLFRALGPESTSSSLKHNIGLTPLALPAMVFTVFFLLNLFLWGKGSSGSVPFTTMLVLIFIYFLLSVPLSFLGSYIALKRLPVYTSPVRTNQIPRQIPEAASISSTWSATLNRPWLAILLSGILPFGAIFVELHFTMQSLWADRIYYMFGFLFVCFGLLTVTVAAVTVLNVYFCLCSENYHWQWRAFATAASCSVYVFANAIVFWISRLSFGSWTSGVLYLGYSAVGSALVGVLCGAVGFVVSWAFVHGIYGSLKVD